MTVMLLTGDLMVVSRLEGTATRKGIKVLTVPSAEQAIEHFTLEPAEVFLIDLGLQSLDVQKLVDQVRTAGTAKPYFIAFGPHVHEGRLNAARQAGCDEVVSRGQFLMQLDAILERHQPG